MSVNQEFFPLKKKDGRFKAMIQAEYCKGCGICLAFCPEKTLIWAEKLNSFGYPVVELADEKACRGCLQCFLMCPDVVFNFSRGMEGHGSGNVERQ